MSTDAMKTSNTMSTDAVSNIVPDATSTDANTYINHEMN